MPRSPWPRRKPSTKRDSEDVAAPSGGSSLPLETRGLDSRGSELPPEDAATARRPSIRKIALDILARREHSVAELREKLASRDFDPGEVETTLLALTDEGLLSEERFLENFVGSYTRRGHGPVWLRAELERRGIASARITATLASLDVDWAEAAEVVRRKRFGAKVPADFKEQARQARFLQYRGFTAEQARTVFKTPPDE